MNPGRYNIIARQGATFTLTFTIATDGTLWDLTGYTARMQVRPFTESSTVLLSLTNGSGITLGGAAGSVAVAISATTLAGLPAGTHVYDLELVEGANVYPVLSGKFAVRAEVTR